MLLAVAAAAFLVNTAAAHPGSGIVADRQGQIYFVDTGAGVWKIDVHGVLTQLPGPRFHWMTIDPDNRFAKTPMPSGPGWEIARVGANPTLFVASDFPIAIDGDGDLVYPAPTEKEGVQIRRMTPAGTTSVLARLTVRWVNGLAAGPDGSLYFTEDRTIKRIDKQGRVVTVVAGVTVDGCVSIPGNEAEVGPYLRGFDVDKDGTIFVAAAGCGSVLKITADGKVTTLFQTAAPWSPTAVVHVGGDLYALEYLHTATEDRRAWRPRVRKISPDGKSAIIAIVDRS